MQRFPFLTGLAMTAALAAGAVACGADGQSSGGSDGPASEGKQLSIDNGCAACHGSDGQGGVGPPLVGLAGTTVELEDGSTVVADTEYLRESILDPAAKIRPGYTVNMPQRTFDDGEVDIIVEWIESL